MFRMGGGKGECRLPYRKFRVVLVISLFVFNVSDWQTTWRASGGGGNNVPGETCVCALAMATAAVRWEIIRDVITGEVCSQLRSR